MLHPSIEVKDSSIHGTGLFALELIPAHSVLWKLDSCDAPVKLEDIPKDKWHLAYSYRDDQYVLTTDGSQYTNHSCDANTWWIDDETMTASRDIFTGEEITYDYATSEANYWHGWTCHCGAHNCRKVITGQDCRRREFRQRYQGHLPSWTVAFIEQNSGIRGVLYRSKRRIHHCLWTIKRTVLPGSS
jgi:hypothetical protein